MNATVDQYALFSEPAPVVSRVMAHKGYPLQLGWLTKAVSLIESSSDTEQPLSPTDDDDLELAMVRLGIGKSMIPAMRHWAHAANLVVTRAGREQTTEVARALATVDPFFEEAASLWLIHWNISTQKQISVHSWFFNHHFQGRFVRQDLVTSFIRFASTQNLRVSENMAGRDVDCFLKNYATPSGQDDIPFSMLILRELGLMRAIGKKAATTYAVDTGARESLPAAIFAFALVEFWHDHFRHQKTMAFDQLLTATGSPGLVFRLTEGALADRLESASTPLGNRLRWTDTLGLRQLQCDDIHALYSRKHQLITEGVIRV